MSWYKYAVKAKRNKGMKNAGHGLNPGRRYWCHASDSLTEPSGPAASQRAHIPISLHHEPKFSQDCHQAIPSHSRSLILTLTGWGIARLGIWQLYSCLWSYFAGLQLALMAQSGSRWHDTTVAASRVQAMAGIFHPFVSLCFHCIFLNYSIEVFFNQYLAAL